LRGKDIWDCKRAVDYLLTLDEVDKGRIGCVGHSLGACIAIHAAAVDDRIGVTISNSGWYPSRLSKNTYLHARKDWWSDAPFLQPYATAGKLFPIDLHEHIAMIAPRPVMLIHPLNDEQYTVEEESVARPAFENLIKNVRQVYGIFDAEDNYRHLLHSEGHPHFERLHSEGYDFFDEMFEKYASPPW
jgi:pimeloyl-ACP methyl ester carboxylesterase